MPEQPNRQVALDSGPTFVQRCRVCGVAIQTPWGPEVHSQSAFQVRRHVVNHSERELLDYALREALRGV